MDGVAFLNNILQTAEVADARSAPYIAFVVAMPTTNTATIYRLEEDATSAYDAKMLTPFRVNAGDAVLAIQIGRNNVVLGRIEPTTLTPFVLQAGLRLWNAGDLRLFSDAAGTVQTIWLDNDLGEAHVINLIASGSVGAASFAGPLTGDVTGKLTGPAPDAFRFATSSASNATVGSTTNTTTYQEGCSVDITLPVGTWTIYAVGGASFSHNTSGGINVVVEIDGATDTVRTVTAPDTGPITLIDNHERGGVAGNRDVTLRTMYKANTAGTVNCRNPFLYASARRTA